MSQQPLTALRNTRKHFLRCVDCGCQTLPQHASEKRPWAAAASLHIAGCVNHGALCFNCANRRRALLGRPVEQNGPVTKSGFQPVGPASAGEATLKTVRVNQQEYAWKITTLASVIERWKDHCFYEEHKKIDSRWWRVVVNDVVISAKDFGSLPICDGDEISIVLGRGRYLG